MLLSLENNSQFNFAYFSLYHLERMIFFPITKHKKDNLVWEVAKRRCLPSSRAGYLRNHKNSKSRSN
jgi:hypothetical protein